MSKIYQSQYSGSTNGDVTLTFKHTGIVRKMVITATAPTNLVVRRNGSPVTDFDMDLPANTRVVHLMLFPVVPGNTITILNPSNSNLEYEIYYA